MKIKTRGALTLAFLCFILGLFFSLYKSSLSSTPQSNALSERMDNLVSTVDNLEQEISTYEGLIQTYRDELAEIEGQRQPGTLQLLNESLNVSKVRAGLTMVSGPGLTIVLDDNVVGHRANPNEDPNLYIIHYEDILGIVGDLKAAGAEAIAINEQRLITTSELRCVGNVILVNTNRIAPPFIIQAIGNPTLMQDTVRFGRLDYLRVNQFPVELALEETLILPAYRGDLQFKYTTFS